MKTTLKTIIGGAALGLALLAPTSPTWAGEQLQSEVVIEPSPGVFGSMDAHGAMNGARYSKDKKQFIGCLSAGHPNFEFAGCYALDRNGAWLSCLTYDLAMIATVSAMTDSAFIFFRKSKDNACVLIEVDGSSAHLR